MHENAREIERRKRKNDLIVLKIKLHITRMRTNVD